MTEAVQERPSFGHRWMSGAEVRRAFVEFFRDKDHRDVPSSSLVPHNDPTVLLTTAGMQQMTPYFLGLETPPAHRLTSVQKCFRTVDIDEVGDESHCTFFFMLGNFSVGDYFKSDSLRWSWEFLTEVMGFDPERLYPTVHPDDEDAYRIWRDEIGVPEERIGKLSDNWWGPVGPTGPNGPDSEIYFDLGEEISDYGDGPGESPRFLEVWNNVFMEFMQAPDGSRTPLPRQNVDTGMGLERLTMLAQGVYTVYDTDIYQAIIQKAADLANVEYGLDEETNRALRVIADHSRAATFLISDGVLPGNEGRSYVLRRVLRRAIRFGRRLGLTEPFLAEMTSIVIDQFGDHYPNLIERRSQIEKVVSYEEASFGRTLDAGLNRFQNEVRKLMESKPVEAEQSETVMPGEVAFRLYDTFGFPLDLMTDLALEQGIVIDQVGFERAMQNQRLTSKRGGDFGDSSRDKAALYAEQVTSPTEFVGYQYTEADAHIVAMFGRDGVVSEAEAGDEIDVILNRTPFYGESGGQIGDKGQIRTDTGVIDVDDTFKPSADLFVHRGTVAEGFVQVGESVHARIDSARRRAIMRNHTATHLLHRALRVVLSEDTHQAGSLVAPDRLRFDFTSLDAVTPEQVARVSEIVNEKILEAIPVESSQSTYQDAVAAGAMALFGEKYGEHVRVVSIDGFSQELCGGTHVGSTGEIGPFIIVSEGSVAAGVRRIEAITGQVAIARMLSHQHELEALSRSLRVPWNSVTDSVESLRDRVREIERESESLRKQIAQAAIGNLDANVVEIGGVRLMAVELDVDSRDGLRQAGDQLRDQLGSGVLVIGANVEDQPSILVLATSDAVDQGAHAGNLVRSLVPIIDGRGGGRPDRAEGGGKSVEKLPELIAAAPGSLALMLTGITERA